MFLVHNSEEWLNWMIGVGCSNTSSGKCKCFRPAREPTHDYSQIFPPGTWPQLETEPFTSHLASIIISGFVSFLPFLISRPYSNWTAFVSTHLFKVTCLKYKNSKLGAIERLAAALAAMKHSQSVCQCEGHHSWELSE